MSIEVTPVSKKEQNLFLTPAAVHVIIEEEIRRDALDEFSIPGYTPDWDGGRGAHSSSVSFSKISSISDIKNSMASSAA